MESLHCPWERVGSATHRPAKSASSYPKAPPSQPPLPSFLRPFSSTINPFFSQLFVVDHTNTARPSLYLPLPDSPPPSPKSEVSSPLPSSIQDLLNPSTPPTPCGKRYPFLLLPPSPTWDVNHASPPSPPLVPTPATGDRRPAAQPRTPGVTKATPSVFDKYPALYRGNEDVGEERGVKKRPRRIGETPRDSSFGTRDQPCEVCGKVFAKPSARETHLRSHSKETPFVCPERTCGFRFTVLSNMRRHCRASSHGSFSGEMTSEEGDSSSSRSSSPSESSFRSTIILKR